MYGEGRREDGRRGGEEGGHKGHQEWKGEGGGRGREAAIAQLGERQAHSQKIAGSSPGEKIVDGGS